MKCRSVFGLVYETTEGKRVRMLNLQPSTRLVISMTVFLSIFCLFVDFGTQAYAQRLMIETPSPGPFANIFYGKITTTEFFFFEKKYKLERTSNQYYLPSESATGSTRPAIEESIQPTTPISSTVLASIQLEPNELNQCASSARLKGFLILVSNLKGKINSAKIQANADADNCVQRITSLLEKTIDKIKVTREGHVDDGMKIELGLASTATVEKKAEPTQEGKLIDDMTFDEFLQEARLKINGSRVSILSSGWFVFETKESKEELIELELPGREKISFRSFPVVMSKDPKSVSNGVGYNSYMAGFSKKNLSISITEIPFLAQNTTIDGGAGGGIGYGREVPGERRGERFVTMAGIEKRKIWGSFGARASLFYTSARKTVVPQTFTARTVGFYDHSFSDDSIVARISAGSEVFYSEITQKKSKPGPQPELPAALIPSQVVAPLVAISLYKITKGGLIFAPTLQSTPILISNVGFYPSTSQSLEVGYKITRNMVLTLNMGLEIHRFPSEAGDTKLQMDYAIITIKRGVM